MIQENDFSKEVQTVAKEWILVATESANEYGLMDPLPWDCMAVEERCAVMRAFELMLRAGVLQLGEKFLETRAAPVARPTAPIPFPPGGHPAIDQRQHGNL